MSFEKKMQKRVIAKLEPYVPDPYPKTKKRKMPLWGKILLPFTAAAVTCAVAIPLINIYLKNTMLERYVDKLSDTYVDMSNVSAFALWNSSFSKTSSKGSGKLSSISPINDSYKLMSPLKDDQKDWAKDYDGDPTKDNVLVSVDGEGKIKEVVYEQTNGKGVIRQTNLGYATRVYSTDNFTFVQYESFYWGDYQSQICAIHQLMSPQNFQCNHEDCQTIVIHNKTGKVFAVKNVIPHVNMMTGVNNYTISGKPYKNDYYCLRSMYTTSDTNIWFKVKYDEEKGISFNDVLEDTFDDYPVWDKYCASSCVNEDKYGQVYVLGLSNKQRKVTKGIVNLSDYEIKYGKFFFNKENQIMYGSDNRMYAFVNDKLNVFKENYTLEPIEQNVKITMVGLYVKESHTLGINGIPYIYDNGLLFSAFGESWKVETDGTLTNKTQLDGLYPKYAENVIATEGILIAMVNCKDRGSENKDIEGELIQISFNNENGEPTVSQQKLKDKIHYLDTSFQHIVVHEIPNYKGNYDNVTWNYYLVEIENGTAKLSLFSTQRGFDTIPHKFVSESLSSKELFYR